MSVSYKKIGMHIRDARRKARMTQAVVAEKLNISMTYYGQLERGDKKFTLDMLGNACELLNVQLEDVMIGALELSNPISDIQPDERRLAYLNSLVKGQSPRMISFITEVVESIIKYERDS